MKARADGTGGLIALLAWYALSVLPSCGDGVGSNTRPSATPGGSPAPIATPAPPLVLDDTIVVGGWTQAAPDETPTGVILRLSRGEWSRASLPAIPRSSIDGLVYSDHATVWAWTASDGGGVMLRSDDDATSFQTAASLLPEDVARTGRSVCDLLFVSPSEAWMLTQAWVPLSIPLADALVLHTTTEGESWQAIELSDLEEAPATSGGCSDPDSSVWLRERGGKVELLRNPQAPLHNPTPARLHTLPDPEGRPIRPSTEQFFALAYATFGDRGWIAGLFDPNAGAPKRSGRLAILSATGDAAWIEQRLPPCPNCFIAAVEFSSLLDGLACGHESGDTACDREPLCLHTRDGGETWEKSTMPDGLRGMSIAGMVRSADGSAALAAADDQDCSVGAGRSTLLQSADRGESWRAAASPVPGFLRARSLVRSP